MKPKPVTKETDPQHLERKTATWRKLQQTQNRSELERDMPTLKQKVQARPAPRPIAVHHLISADSASRIAAHAVKSMTTAVRVFTQYPKF